MSARQPFVMQQVISAAEQICANATAQIILDAERVVIDVRSERSAFK